MTTAYQEAKAASDAAEATLAELTANGGITNAEKAAIDNATAALETARSEAATAETAVTEAKAAQTTAQPARDEINDI